jgi:hypothetical protein
MSRRQLWIALLLAPLLCVTVSPGPAAAATTPTTGLWSVDDCSTISNPVAYKTLCHDQATGRVRMYDGIRYISTNVPFLDQTDFTGADAGAQLQAAHDSSACPSTGCAILLKDSSSTRTLSAVTLTKPVHLAFGCGPYSMTGSFKVSNALTRIETGGIGCSIFTWAGNATSPAWILQGVSPGAIIGGLDVRSSSAHPLLEAVRVIHGAGDTALSSDVTLGNIQIHNTSGCGLRYGVHWDSPDGVDGNNDLTKMQGVRAFNYCGGAALVIQYVGAGSAATMTIAGHTLTTTITGGPGGENLSIDLTNASYDTLSELVSYIDGLAAYTTTLGTGPFTMGASLSAELGRTYAVDIRTAAHTANLWSAAFFVEGTQAGYIRCRDCTAVGNNPTSGGPSATSKGTAGIIIGSPRVSGWNFLWEGSATSNDIADLYVYNGGGPFEFSNNSENSGAMIVTEAGGAGTIAPSVVGGRWGSAQLHSDLRIINWQLGGPLLVGPAQLSDVTGGNAILYCGAVTACEARGVVVGGGLLDPYSGNWQGRSNSAATAAFDTTGKLTSRDFVLAPAAFTDQDTTPSVQNGNLFYTVNSAGTTITNFSNGKSGQWIMVEIADANTTITFSGSAIHGSGGVDRLMKLHDVLICFELSTTWYCSISARYDAPTFTGAVTNNGSYAGTAKVPAANGGTNLDSSGSTGVPQVSSGTWSVSTTLPAGTKAALGGGTGTATVGGVLCFDNAAHTTIGTSEEVLATCVVPANTLNVNARALRVQPWAVHAANTNSATITIRWGGTGVNGTVVGTTTSAVSGAAMTVANMNISRISSNSQRVVSSTANATASVTDSADATIYITGTTASGAGDVTVSALMVEVLN